MEKGTKYGLIGILVFIVLGVFPLFFITGFPIYWYIFIVLVTGFLGVMAYKNNSKVLGSVNILIAIIIVLFFVGFFVKPVIDTPEFIDKSISIQLCEGYCLTAKRLELNQIKDSYFCNEVFGIDQDKDHKFSKYEKNNPLNCKQLNVECFRNDGSEVVCE